MSRRRCALLVSLLFMVTSVLLAPWQAPGAAADPVVIDEFAGGVANATLEFTDRLWDGSLEVELPRGSRVSRADLVLEGVPRSVPEARLLDFSNLTMSGHLWARDAYGVFIYPPRVDPYGNDWSPAVLADLAALATVDGDLWHTETDDDCQPPYEWPVQLYHFNPVVPGATSIEVMWYGFGYNMVNTTTNFHAQLWLYNHTSRRWEMMDSYVSGLPGYHWFRHTILPPSPHQAPNGSIDVAVVGMHSDEQNVGPVILTDQGHLYTDYVAVNATSRGGLQYPADVTLAFGDHRAKTLAGPLAGEVTVGDTHGLADALQAAVDDHVVSPGNLTIALNVSVGAITMGLLEVRGLVIEYEPPENRPPQWLGPTEVEVPEDSGWTAVLDLDDGFHDDHNRGMLLLDLTGVSDGANLSTRIGTNLEGNRTLEVLPARDFFGEVVVTLRAEDLFGEAAPSTDVVVNVTQVPDPPRIGEPGEPEIEEGDPWTHQVRVEDPDLPDDVLVHSVEGAPGGLTIDGPTGVICWTPGDDQVGRHTFNISVVDRFGLGHERAMTVRVLNVNDPPVITSPLEVHAVQDKLVSYLITAHDPDVPFGDELTFDASSEAIAVLVGSRTGLLNFNPTNDHVPGFEVVVRATDHLGRTGEAVITVTVENVNDPPQLRPAGPLTFHQGEEVSVRLLATDPDLGLELPVPERLSFAGEGPGPLLPDGEGWVNLTPTQDLVGRHDVTYTVTDRGGLEDSLTLTWNIIDVNDPPSITTRPDPVVYAFEDAEFALVLEATDPDGDTVRWSDDSALFDIEPTTGRVAFTPLQADVGRHAVVLTASDGRGGEARLTLELEVVGMNDPPVIRSVLPENGTTFREGEKVTFEADVTDEDDVQLTCTWMEGDRELGTGAVLEHRGLSPGRHTITLVVTDGEHTVVEVVVVRVEASEGMGPIVLALVVVLVCLAAAALLLVRRRLSRDPGEGE